MVGQWDGWLLGVKGDSITSHSIPLCHVMPDTSAIGRGPFPQPCVITTIVSTSPLAGQAHSQITCQHQALIPTWQPLARSGVKDAPERLPFPSPPPVPKSHWPASLTQAPCQLLETSDLPRAILVTNEYNPPTLSS